MMEIRKCDECRKLYECDASWNHKICQDCYWQDIQEGGLQ